MRQRHLAEGTTCFVYILSGANLMIVPLSLRKKYLEPEIEILVHQAPTTSSLSGGNAFPAYTVIRREYSPLCPRRTFHFHLVSTGAHKKGNLTNSKNYRPITCLNTLYKIFTSKLNERVLSSIDGVWKNIYEKGDRKVDLTGCKDNLLVDHSIFHDLAYHKRNLPMAWVDYTKAYDITWHYFILTHHILMLRVQLSIQII